MTWLAQMMAVVGLAGMFTVASDDPSRADRMLLVVAAYVFVSGMVRLMTGEWP